MTETKKETKKGFRLGHGIWNLEFIWDLVLGTWCFDIDGFYVRAGLVPEGD
jgi:hypothetical protein